MALAPSRYELLDRIAVGGMAEVFRAKALGAHGFEKTLAIKKIIPELAKDPEFEERFIVEAKLAVALSHANVVQVMDFGRFAGTLFIAMELVDGLDLAALLKFHKEKDEQISIPAAFHISIEMIRGLSFAHSREVVHRDVSPSNVLLSKAGEVKIADFGIATAMHKELGDDAGRVMGKWRYMSPEQTRASVLTESSDIFSAAIVIFEIFSGRKLFPGKSSVEITENIRSMPIPKLSEIRPGVPEAVDVVLAKMFERDVEKRNTSGAEVMRELTEASYTSKIVATALDVEVVVREACDFEDSSRELSQVDGGGIDELIRAQLQSGERVVERRTAVAPEDVGLANTQLQLDPDVDGGTMVKAGVDAAGVTIWQLERETVAASPQSLRESHSDSDAKTRDSERDSSTREGRYFESEGVHTSMRRGVIYAGLVFGGLMVVLVFFALRNPSYEKKSQATAADASLQPLPQPSASLVPLRIESNPPGAAVIIDGQRQKTVTPTSVKWKAGTQVSVKLFLDGYQDYEQTLTIDQDIDNQLNADLVAFEAGLVITTKPMGAEAWLDGEFLGKTPIERADLRPGLGRKVELKLKDHKTRSLLVDLVHNRVFEVRETLKSNLKYGFINISILNGWAQVSENGKQKAYQKSGRYRMSVGVHKLQLFNPPSGKKKSVTVEVFADRIKTYQFRMDL